MKRFRSQLSCRIRPCLLQRAFGGQLYNRAIDPGETTNLYLQQPEIVTELKALLEQSKSSGWSRPRQP